LTRPVRDVRSARARLAGGMFLVIAVVGLWSLVGLPSWTILLAAVVPFALLCWARFGGVVALIATLFAESLTLLGVLMVTALLKLPMLATVEIVWTVLGLGCSVLLWRSTIELRAPTRSALLAALCSLAGSIVWLGTVVFSRILPSAPKLSWAMQGDSANNVLLFRDMLREHGIAIAVGNNPVPLPTAIFATIAASGRGMVKPGSLLLHDISALALTWILLVAVGCVVCGASAAVVARAAGASGFLVGLVAAGASILPLSWFFTGYSLDFGFLDAAVAIPLVLLSFLAYLVSVRRASLSLVLLLCAATLLLAVWSPLVLLPGLFVLVVLSRSWRSIFGPGRVRLWTLALATAQLLGYGLAVSLPNLLSIGHLLAHGGAVYAFHRWMLGALALLLVVLGASATRSLRNPLMLGIAAAVVASGIGLIALLFVSRNQPSVWTYYPVKFAWLCSAVFVVLILGVVAGVISNLTRARALRLIGAFVAAFLTVGFLVWAPSAVPGYQAASAPSQLLKARPRVLDDGVAARIFRFASPQRAVVLWHSGDPDELTINFWTMQMWAGTLQGHVALRTAAYGGYDDNSVPTLCNIVELMGTGITIYSDQRSLQSHLDATCPRENAHVEREPAR
jgi:hypothetical protein